MSQSFKAFEWQDGAVVMLDQRLLPSQEMYNRYGSVEEVAEAIRQMVVRGAPAIGCAAALGVALAAHNASRDTDDRGSVEQAARAAIELLQQTRPTAVNLFGALARMEQVLIGTGESPGRDLADALLQEAQQMIDEDAEANRRLGHFGAALLPAKATVLTHCNTGALATAGYGTALGVIRAAVEEGKAIRVLADETRPLLQGARLTAWELHREGIPVTVIPDNQAAALMRLGRVDAAIVGADRIAANGDVANKIGTYGLAVLCRHHGIPFFVAAPTTTIDLATPVGGEIPIEQRAEEEVAVIGTIRFTPEHVPASNLAFDVTPRELVDAIITERGVARAPYDESLAALLNDEPRDV